MNERFCVIAYSPKDLRGTVPKRGGQSSDEKHWAECASTAKRGQTRKKVKAAHGESTFSGAEAKGVLPTEGGLKITLPALTMPQKGKDQRIENFIPGKQ